MKRTQILKVLHYLLLVGISLGLVALLLKQQEIKALWVKVTSGNYFWYAPVIVVTLICHWFRALRWRLMLENGAKKSVSQSNTFIAIIIGYFINFFTIRGGEVVRCSVLKRTDDISFRTSLGTVVAERAIDVICILLLLMFVLIWFSHLLHDFVQVQVVQPVQGLIAGSENLIILGFVAFVVISVVLLWILKSLNKKETRIGRVLTQFFDGLLVVFRIPNKIQFLAYTAVIWLMYVYMTYFWFFAFEETSGFGFGDAVIIITIAGFGRSLPLPALGLGAYHLIVEQLVMILGGTQDIGIVLGSVIHAGQSVFYLVLGGICCIYYLIRFRKMDRVILDKNEALSSEE